MKVPALRRKLAFDERFLRDVGLFNGTWSAFDIISDYAVGQFLGLPHEITHLLTAGLEFHRKARLLRELIQRSDHTKKKDLLTALNVLQNEGKRNVFAHSFMRSRDDRVTFVERTRHGPLQAKEHHFTGPEFQAHVLKVVEAANTFQLALGVTSQHLEEFGAAFKRAASSESTSPQPPVSSE